MEAASSFCSTWTYKPSTKDKVTCRSQWAAQLLKAEDENNFKGLHGFIPITTKCFSCISANWFHTSHSNGTAPALKGFYFSSCVIHKHLSLINEVKYQLHVSDLKSFKALPYTPSCFCEYNCELQFINSVNKEKVQKNFCPNSQPDNFLCTTKAGWKGLCSKRRERVNENLAKRTTELNSVNSTTQMATHQGKWLDWSQITEHCSRLLSLPSTLQEKVPISRIFWKMLIL